MITQREKDKAREELELKKRHLEDSLKNYSAIFTEAPKNVEDRASFVTTRLIAESNHKASKKMLQDVIVALARLDNGTWGICVDCGEEISEDRRAAMCWVSRDKSCQEKIGLRVR